MKDIRQITTSFNGHLIGLCEFEKRIQIFDIVLLKVISEFDTVLSFGGQRFAISEDGNVCICGSWDRQGICAYETKTGKLIWQRKDLKKVQKIKILYHDKCNFFAEFEMGASRIIDIYTGVDKEKINGALYYLNSKFLPIDIIVKSFIIQIVNKETKKILTKIKRNSYTTLDLDIADNCFAISEAVGPLSCYDIESGKLRWRITLNDDMHFAKVCFNKEMNFFIGVTLSYKNGVYQKLIYINKDNGAIEKEMTINRPHEVNFALNGQVLITSDREIINLSNRTKKNWS